MSSKSFLILFLKKKKLYNKSLKQKKKIKNYINNYNYNLINYFNIYKRIFYYIFNLMSLKIICFVSGRSRGVLRFFGLSRFVIKQKLYNNQLPGFYK